MNEKFELYDDLATSQQHLLESKILYSKDDSIEVKADISSDFEPLLETLITESKEENSISSRRNRLLEAQINDEKYSLDEDNCDFEDEDGDILDMTSSEKSSSHRQRILQAKILDEKLEEFDDLDPMLSELTGENMEQVIK